MAYSFAGIDSRETCTPRFQSTETGCDILARRAPVCYSDLPDSPNSRMAVG